MDKKARPVSFFSYFIQKEKKIIHVIPHCLISKETRPEKIGNIASFVVWVLACMAGRIENSYSIYTIIIIVVVAPIPKCYGIVVLHQMDTFLIMEVAECFFFFFPPSS